MLPLLLTAGRMLVTDAAKNVAKGAIAKTVKDKAMDAAKDKVVSIAKDNIKDKKKRISTKKLFAKTKTGGGGGGRGGGGSRGGGLILRQSSAIVKQSKGGALVKTNGEKKGEEEGKGGPIVKSSNIREEILKELEAIKINVVKVKEISAEKLLNQKQDDKQRYLESRKKKSEEQEKNLESKKDTKKKKKLGITAPKLGFFDMVKNYLLNVLIGSLVVFLLKQGPLIIKMFTEIGKNLTNVWQVLRLGIITLTTVFPRQVRTILSFTRKIIGPPARLIGRLLLKAGGVAGTLFKKAGGIIFNLIKGPLTSLVKRVGGEALERGVKSVAKGVANRAGDLAKRGVGRLATRATLAVGGKGLVKRLATLSKIFKRVPIVGALIGIGIDLALGEKLDRALAGAAGAALGSGLIGVLGGAVGGAIGSVVPFAGTLIGAAAGKAIGGFLGAAVGDWAGKAIFDNLNKKVPAADKENPIEQRAYGGSINIRGANNRSLPRANTGVQRKTTTTTALSQQTLNKAKDTILKDEASAKRFANLSSAYGAIPFVGEAMKLGLDVSLGERVSKSRTDAIAESIGSTIGMALKNDEFSVRGFNKRIIGEFSKNLTNWAKRKIFISVKSQENQFKSFEDKKKQSEGSSGPGGADGGEDLGPIEEIKPGTVHQKGAQVAKNLMRLLNIKDYQAAGIVGNIIQESNLVPDVLQGGRRGPLKLDGVTGYSYPQWTSIDRQRAFANYMEKKGHDWRTKGATDELATGFLAQEFKGYMSNVFTNTKDAAAASNWVLKNYEKPADQGPREQKERAQDSMAVLKKIGGQGGGYGFNHHKLPLMAMGGGHTVTSEMGLRNFALSPGMHMGVDISGTTGEPLQAFTDGTVEATSPPSPSAGYGNWINWIDSNGIGHFYGHMNKPPFVKAGQKIKKGTILGELGSTGKSSGPHLHWEAATNPRDNGMPKNNVLSRFNPLSKYNKESPFGGSIRPDPSMAAAASTSGSPGSSTSPGSSATPEPSEFVKNFKVIGDPAASKGGPKGGGSAGGAITWKEWGKYLRGLGFIPNENAFDPGKYDNSAHATPDHGHNAMDAGWWKDNNYVANTKKWEKIFAPLEGDAFGQVIGPIEDPRGHGNGTNTHLHFTARKLDSKGLIPLTDKLKALMGNPNPTASDTGSGGGGGGVGGGGGAPSAPPEPSEFVKNFKVLGDPSIKKSTDEISQTPSYNKSGNAVILMQSPVGGQAAPPIRSRSSGNNAGPVSVGGMVNSYGMVSKQIISSSLYKL